MPRLVPLERAFARRLERTFRVGTPSKTGHRAGPEHVCRTEPRLAVAQDPIFAPSARPRKYPWVVIQDRFQARVDRPKRNTENETFQALRNGFRNDNQCVLNKPWGYTGDISRAARLCFDRGKNDQRQADRDEQLNVAKQVFHVDLRLASCEVRRHWRLGGTTSIDSG